MEKQGNSRPAVLRENVLVSGASFAGLSTAYWLNKLGYKVTVVEIADGLKKGGTPVDIREGTVEIVRRMGLLDAVRLKSLPPRTMEFRNSDDVPDGPFPGDGNAEGKASEEYEIERDVLLDLLFDLVGNDVEFMFGNRIVELREVSDEVDVTFADGSRRAFSLVFGCDGNHSAVRKMIFGEEAAYSHFLGQYFSVTIVDKLLAEENTTQIHTPPERFVMLNAYNGKTDIVLGFSSDEELQYDYRNEEQQRRIILDRFAGSGWRIPELLEEVAQCKDFYFDKMSQIKMPSWTKGRVALVGDGAHCASPAAGMGGSLAIVGAAALAEAFARHDRDYVSAFRDYNESLRPFVEQVQAQAVDFATQMFDRK